MSKIIQKTIVLVMCTFICGTISATTNYVVTPGTPGVIPTANYTSWATAATNIQDAIDVAVAGNLILVTNGTYYLTNQIEIGTAITLRSFNNGATDRDGTIIDGNYPTTTNRCIYINHSSAVLDGFTITNGFSLINSLSGHGGGIYNKGTVTNCVVIDCEARGNGGGIYIDGEATLTHSTISGNVATNNNASNGGGVYMWYYGGLVSDCVIKENTSNTGGGVFMRGMNSDWGSVIQNSTIANNDTLAYIGGHGAGGIGMQFRGTVDNCVIASNTAFRIEGTPYTGGVRLHNGGILINSLIIDNTLPDGGFGAGVSVGGALGLASNCVIRGNTGGNGGGIHLTGTALIVDSTIVSNSSAAYCQGGTMRNCLVEDNDGYGLWSHTVTGTLWENNTVVGNSGFGMRFSQSNTVINCIVYNNNNGGANWSHDNNTSGTNSVWVTSCTTPELTGLNDTGNITNNPIFAAASEGNYRLTSKSPCLNTGTDLEWMIGAVDLDGNPRLVGVKVDMGAYEFPPPLGTLIIVK